MVCGILVGAIGCVTLAEYISGWNAGIDQILTGDRPTLHASHPGRMGANTALAFTLLAIPLLRSGSASARWRAIREACATGAALIALAALLGYLYSASSLVGIASSTAMALHTALLFVVTCVGVLARDRDGPLMTIALAPGPGRVVVRRLLPSVAAVLLAAATPAKSPPTTPRSEEHTTELPPLTKFVFPFLLAKKKK